MTDKELIKEIDARIAESDDSLLSFAKRELGMILEGCKDKKGWEMQELVNAGILRSVYIFTLEDHSGFSAGYAIPRIERLLRYHPLSPITESDFKEENSHETKEGTTCQCRRCSSVFRDINKKTGKVSYHDIDKYVFSDNGGATWFGTRGCCGLEGLTDEITLPYDVPDHPERIYVRELPDGMYERVTDADEIEEMYKAFKEEVARSMEKK